MAGGFHRNVAALSLGVAVTGLMPAIAFAQTPGVAQDDRPAAASAAEPQAVTEEEIVVTGTLLRGIAPTGAEPIVMDREDVIATGATSTAQLLANIPQTGDFASRPINRGVFNTQDTVNHPELRNLVGGIAGGGSATLLLLDGHRLPGMGVRQTIPDSDVVPPGAIERVEIVTDGGSAIYGADAVGGVVNYIIRRRFDGIEADASYGFADDYQTISTNITAGKDWGSGSAFATYSFGWHDAIYGRDRDYARRRDYVLDVPFDLTCDPGNVIIGGTSIYALPNLVPGIGNRCDVGDDETIYPREKRHSFFAGLTQQITDNLEFRVHGFYTNRVNNSDGGDLTTTATITRTIGQTNILNPFYRNIPGPNANRSQSVSVSFAPILGRSTLQRTELNTWGISPSLSWDIGGGWQFRALFNYGEGKSEGIFDDINTGAFATLVAAGLVNPYNLLDPANAPYLPQVTNYRNYGLGKHKLINYRGIFDGPLFSAPGGEARLAVGAEYIIEDYKVQSGVGPRTTSGRPRGEGHRNTKAFFGELLIPIVGDDNNGPGLHSMKLSVSGRYDDYSDFGTTFNPKLALTVAPVEWLEFRGNWGKSFQAPSLADAAGAVANSITALPRVLFPNPASPPPNGNLNLATIFLSGGGQDLRPQKATSLSFGADIDPPFIPGLKLSTTYYNIKFKDMIAIPPVQDASTFYPLFTDLYIMNPTIAQVIEFASQAPGGLSAVTPYIQQPGQVYVIADGRRTNLSNINTSGIDFTADYNRRTGFGSIFSGFSANYVLSRKVQPKAGAPFTQTVRSASRLQFSATAGASIGNFRAQVTLQHSGGYRVQPTTANLQQTRVAAYNLVNLFFKYDLEGRSLLKDTSLTLNIDNVFDNDPPLYRTVDGFGGGYANGSTLGRLVQFGIRKRF